MTDDDGGAGRRQGASGGLAPVIALFGGGGDLSERWDATWATPADGGCTESGASRASHGGRLADDGTTAPDDRSAEATAAAEAALLRKLRTRQLSSSEARAVLREHELDAGGVDALVARFEHRGYLDDTRLAEQLVHAAVTRKGQGRHAIATTLAKRGIARAVVDAALQTLPDDDLERALEYARTKVRRAGDRDRDAALRRLVGQLSRRGYPSSTALAAARTALDEGPG